MQPARAPCISQGRAQTAAPCCTTVIIIIVPSSSSSWGSGAWCGPTLPQPSLAGCSAPNGHAACCLPHLLHHTLTHLPGSAMLLGASSSSAISEASAAMRAANHCSCGVCCGPCVSPRTALPLATGWEAVVAPATRGSCHGADPRLLHGGRGRLSTVTFRISPALLATRQKFLDWPSRHAHAPPPPTHINTRTVSHAAFTCCTGGASQ